MHYLVTHLGILPGFEVSLNDDEFIFLDKRRLFTARLLKWFPGVALMIVLAIGQQSFFKMSVYAEVFAYRPHYVLVMSTPWM